MSKQPDPQKAIYLQPNQRQVLGVRMGMAAGRWLGLALPQTDKRLLTIAETDGCGADGISAATGCWVGRRTLRIMDFGKMAATFVDTDRGRAVRIAPSAESRQLAPLAAPDARNHWEAYLLGYQRMTDEDLLAFQPVHNRVLCIFAQDVYSTLLCKNTHYGL